MKNKFGILGVLFGTLLLSGILVTSCNKDDDDGGNNDGKIDPSTIAASSLIAYFPFETEGEDVQFSDDNITFNQKVGAAALAAGRRGNAYKGSASEAYFEYDVDAASSLKTLDEITLACWIKTPRTTAGAAKIFAVNGGDGFMGTLTLMQESQVLGDSVDMKFYLFDSESPDWKGQDIRRQSASFVNDMWFHVIAVYNKTNSTMEFYANGELVHTSIKYAGPVPEVGEQPLLGPIKLGQDMTTILVGAWPQQVAGTPEGWMTYFHGMVDELRIYNKALTVGEIEDLYEAEVTQIE
jgi:hypothetical protein